MTDERRKALEALEFLEDVASLKDGATREAVINAVGCVRRALTEPAVPAYDSEGNDLSDPTAWEQPAVPDAVREIVSFAQRQIEEPDVMHVSDMARLIRDYALAQQGEEPRVLCPACQGRGYDPDFYAALQRLRRI